MIRQSSSYSSESTSISQSRSFRVEDGLLIEEILSTTAADDTKEQLHIQEDTSVPPTNGTGTNTGSNYGVTVDDENANDVNDNSISTSISPTRVDYKTEEDQHEIPNNMSSDSETKTNTLICALLGNCTKPKHNRHHHHHHHQNDNDDDELTIVDMPSPADIIGKTSISTTATTDSKTNNDTATSIPHVECQIDPITKQCQNVGLYSTCKHSLYRHPKSITELKDIFEFNVNATRLNTTGVKNDDIVFSNHTTTSISSSTTSEEEILQNQLLWKEGGLLWYSTILPNDYNHNPKSLKIIQKKDYDDINNCIKPRRGTLAIVQDDFFHSLVKIPLAVVQDDDMDDKMDNNTTKKDGMKMTMRHDGDEYDNRSADGDDHYEIFDDNDDSKHVHKTTQQINNNSSQHLHIHPKPEITNKQYSKWIFSGVLNGFPGLKNLELLKIEYKSTLVPRFRTHWSTYDNHQDKSPTYPKKVIGLMEVRAQLREPGWSAMGWSKDSLGYVLYYQPPETRKVPRVLYGTNIIKQLEEDRYEQVRVVDGRLQPSPKCVKVHMISHRYAMINEKWKNRITYHSFAFLEWDHGKYCTVIELAFLNGLGGYNGRCNHAVVSCG